MARDVSVERTSYKDALLRNLTPHVLKLFLSSTPAEKHLPQKRTVPWHNFGKVQTRVLQSFQHG